MATQEHFQSRNTSPMNDFLPPETRQSLIQDIKKGLEGVTIPIKEGDMNLLLANLLRYGLPIPFIIATIEMVAHNLR